MADLQEIAETCARIDERTRNMQAENLRVVEALHKRIDTTRKEAKDDVEDVRGEMKRMAGIISTAVSGLVTAVTLAIKGLIGGSS